MAVTYYRAAAELPERLWLATVPGVRPAARSAAGGRMVPVLVGRDGVLAEIGGALSAAAQGTGGLLVLEGPAGIGKSAVLAAAARQARAQGVAVAAGRPTGPDRPALLAPLLDALRSADPPVLTADGVGALADLGGSRILLADRLGEMIAAYTRTRPLLVVLDGMQWADDLTAFVLRALVPALAAEPVLWLIAQRPLPAHPAGHGLVARWGAGGDPAAPYPAPRPAGHAARRLVLEPLPAPAVALLCARVLGATPDPSVLALASRAGGNPALLRGLLGTLRDRGAVVVRDGTATALTSELPADFLAAVDRGLDELSAEARRLLEAGAVLGRPFSLHEAAGLLNRPVGDLVAAVREAIETGAVVDRGGTLDFSHDVLREAVYGGMVRSVRRALHREAAEVLREEPKPVTEIVGQVARSTPHGDLQAVSALRDAARQLVPTAPAVAADMLVSVLELVGPDHPDRAAVLAEAAELLTEARGLNQASGADRDAAGVERRLDLVRARPARSRAKASSQTGWDSLTASELRVVDLVAMGLRNREVAERLHLSPHTVDSHLRHAYTKLGVSSRVQLTRHAIARMRIQDQVKT
jgi:DNA-binding CsgD family transcriptional regulator